MLRWVILVVAVVVLTGGATLVVQYLPDPDETPKVAAPVEIKGPQPRLEIEGDLVYNFGKMPKQDEAAHTWVVKNTGEAPLEISLFGKTTCSCTVSKPGEGETMAIPPGQSNTIELHWHTKKDLPEDYSQGANFHTNDPRKPMVTLGVKGKVYPAVVVYPPDMIHFPRVSNEEPHVARFAVYSKERPELKLPKVATSKPGLIVAEVKPMTPQEAEQIKVDKGYMVTVTIKPGMPVGDFHEEIVLQTDHPKQPEVRVAVAGSLFGPISATPERVRITNVVSRKGASVPVVLTVAGEKDRPTTFTVDRKPRPLEVDIAPDEKASSRGRYRMTVKVPPGAPTGTVSGDIVLKTDDPRASEVKIPVSILITRSGPG